MEFAYGPARTQQPIEGGRGFREKLDGFGVRGLGRGRLFERISVYNVWLLYTVMISVFLFLAT